MEDDFKTQQKKMLSDIRWYYLKWYFEIILDNLLNSSTLISICGKSV